ncbi:MAG: L,D-transpeptidase [Anaerolineales bacterium]|jgi:hypothetical protein
MRWKWLVILGGLLIVAGLSAYPAAAAPPASESRPPGDDYLCSPRLQLRHPQLCPDQGPGSRLADLSRMGLYPEEPLPLVSDYPSLFVTDRAYLKPNEGDVYIYPTAEAAITAEDGEGSIGTVDKGYVYLVYSQAVSGETRDAYRVRGGYLRSDQVKLVGASGLSGLIFSRTPDRPFGWINSGGICTRRTPGEDGELTGNCYVMHHVVQIYDSEQVGDWTWYMIGVDEWIEQRFLAIVDPDPTPPEGVEGDKWISVNLYEQTLAAYEGGELVFATAASTGRNGLWTQPGLFEIWARLDYDTMTGGIQGDEDSYYYLESVPWVMYFDQARALHGTYWHSKFGNQTSAGCVNLSTWDARWLYIFAEMGTPVFVWDPSGKTPTDPASYGPGGA